uniref:Uncharacterized protein n=1 Tax=Caenorhabditis tropicalis TaxID=1561998 RepID=A0A1I7T0D3_9PELO
MLVISSFVEFFALELNGKTELTINIEKTSVKPTEMLKYEKSDKRTPHSTFLEYCFIIGTSAVLGHYLIQKFIEETKEQKVTNTISHATFEINGVTYILLKCNDEEKQQNKLASKTATENIDGNEIGESYI